MKTILFVAALACIVGCDKKKNEGGGAGTDPCATAIGKAIDAMIAGRQKMIDSRAAAGASPPPGAMDQMTEISNKLRAVMTERCKADQWPEPAIACFSTATDQPGIKKCRELLPQEMSQKLQVEIIKIMSAGRPGAGPGGGMPHGAASGSSGAGSAAAGGAAAGSGAP